MAAPFAYEQPTINASWQALLLHLPTILLIWVISLLFTFIGYGVGTLLGSLGLLVGPGQLSSDAASGLSLLLNQLGQLPFTILSSFVGVLFTAVPAMHYETGNTISLEAAFRELLRRPARYLLAGALFAVIMTIGFLFCVLPGIAVALVMPVYINKIFNGEEGIVDALRTSFQAVYRSPNTVSFLVVEVCAWMLVILVTVCTCLVGGIIAGPLATFYVQNAAYRMGILH